mmetsp:Transcript_163150/g.523170  ORF Transcript_163150/g.523170 Transcript_163150/m.523170 type:complete len:236 (-) Transcript_163150:1434-2141(-)
MADERTNYWGCDAREAGVCMPWLHGRSSSIVRLGSMSQRKRASRRCLAEASSPRRCRSSALRRACCSASSSRCTIAATRSAECVASRANACLRLSWRAAARAARLSARRCCASEALIFQRSACSRRGSHRSQAPSAMASASARLNCLPLALPRAVSRCASETCMTSAQASRKFSQPDALASSSLSICCRTLKTSVPKPVLIPRPIIEYAGVTPQNENEMSASNTEFTAHATRLAD